MNERKEYEGVDIFKFICAILVIAIHTKPFANNFWLDNAVGLLTRFAVPFFFTCSGYFLFLKLNSCASKGEENIVVKSYMVRLIRFYSIWYVLFFLNDLLLGNTKFDLLQLLKQYFFTTNGSPLWFLNALIWGMTLVLLLRKVLKDRAILAISLFFFALGYLFSTLFGITQNVKILVRLKDAMTRFIGIQNGLFYAFPYISMSMLLSKKQVDVFRKEDLAKAILFWILLGIEALITVIVLSAPLTFLWICAIPMTWYVMKVVLSFKSKESPWLYAVRKMSTLMYVLHVIIFKILQVIFANNGIDKVDRANLILFFSTVILSISISFVLVRLSNRKNLPWIKSIM